MAPTQAALRVVFAEDNYLVREGTAALLAEVDEVELVRLVEDPSSLLKAVREESPDAVLTDIRMPPTYSTEGIDAAKRIRSEYPGTGVVVLSQYVEPDYAFELLADGVAGLGYLLKERVSQVEELVRALQEVCRGGSVLDPKVVEGLLARRSAEVEAGSPLARLTERELEVLRLMATGRSNAAIARQLYLSERAIEKHISALFQKLDLAAEADVNRRVAAVLTFLEARTST
jgi:DNA-binding NarL/FixJ family response regulator